MTYIDSYIDYISGVRRYSPRTCEIYRESLEMFRDYLVPASSPSRSRQTTERVNAGQTDTRSGQRSESGRILVSKPCPDDERLPAESLTPCVIRSYEVHLLEDRHMSPRTVNLHISVLSGFCRYLLRKGILHSNPARTVTRPRTGKRLPEFYREESMKEYLSKTVYYAGEDSLYVPADPGQKKHLYEKRLGRAIVSVLYSTGIRRSELTGLDIRDIDFSRNTMTVRGKGDKMREIPLLPSLLKEISLYLQSVEMMVGTERTPASPLFVTFSGRALYPGYVDRTIKRELGEVPGITGKKSPHVLRHTLATELLDRGADLNAIKELLGHSSLAATQVYTHNSIGRLKKVYESAHPRARKNGGKNGD